MMKRYLPPLAIGAVLTGLALISSPINAGFQPHAVCLQNDWRVIGPLVIGDLIIWLCYMAIPAIIWIDYKRIELPGWVATVYIAFIFFCGIGHLFDAVTFFSPIYALKALSNSLTAIVSVGTVIGLTLNRAWLYRPTREELRAVIASLEATKAEVESIEDSRHSVHDGVRKATASINELIERLDTLENSLVAGKA